MREIEIKAKVKNLNELIKTVEKLGGKLSAAKTQHDRVFTRGDQPGAAGSTFLRIRTETNNELAKHYFTLKRMVTGHGDKLEFETEIADDEIMLGAFNVLDFRPYVEVKKTRRSARISKYEICLDSVDNLGDFVEVEFMALDDSDHVKIENELWEFAKKLGIEKPAEPLKGYDVMLKNKEEK